MAAAPTDRALTGRSLIVGCVLSLLIAAYSAYAGLKVGGVYWPILTATLLAMGIFRLLGGAGSREINVAATAASTGGLQAAGVIFTLPAAWLLGIELSPWRVAFLALVGGLLGVLFTIPLRREMLERLALPYPDGTATARVLEAGDSGGGKVRRVLAAAGVGGLFALLRDRFGWLPAVVSLDTAGSPWARFASLGSSLTLVAPAGGYLIGPRFTGAWFAGAAAAHLLAAPLAVSLLPDRFADRGAVAAAVTRPGGIGLIVGASAAYFLLAGLPSFLPMALRLWRAPAVRKLAGLALLALVTGVLAWSLTLPYWLTAAAVVGAFFTSYVAARIAGELNIDPMEVLAIALLLLVLFFVPLEPLSAVVFAAVLCLAAGMAGDFMQDLKAGALLGTRPADQAKAQLVAVVVTAPALGFILVALLAGGGLGEARWPAPQAVALAELIEAGGITGALAWGAAAGALLTAGALAAGWGILPIAFGIGLYAPMELSLPLFAGGLLRAWVDRRGEQATERGRLLAAGAIGGEGLVGVALALLGLLAAL